MRHAACDRRKTPHRYGRRSVEPIGKNNRPGDGRACCWIGPKPASCRLRPVVRYRDASVLVVPMPCAIMPSLTAALQHIRAPLMTLTVLDKLAVRPYVRRPVPHIVPLLVDITFPRSGHDLDALGRWRDADFHIDKLRRLPDCSEAKRADCQRQGGNNISQLHNVSLSLIAPQANTTYTARSRGRRAKTEVLAAELQGGRSAHEI